MENKKVEMNRCEYVPAIGEQFNSVWVRNLIYKGKDGKEYDMRFFTDKSHFQHPIALQSIYYAIEGVGKRSKGKSFREMIGFPDNKTLISDSAGFQIATFKKKGEVCNIEPIDSLRNQENGFDVCMNLDIPPNLDGTVNYNSFCKALDESIENFKMFTKERKNKDMKLLNVLHGETIPLLDKWYNGVKDFKFDGWAIGIKPPFDPMLQALGFMYLWEKGEFEKDSCKWIHFFGTSGKHVVPTLVYAAHKLNKIQCTFDSSSYNIGSIYRTYYLPFDIGPHLSFGDKFKIKNPHIKKLPCQCPVCRTITSVDELNGGDIYAGTLISLHNLYQYKQYNDLLNSLVVHKELFLDYLNKINISEKALKSIEFIDFVIENGLENGVRRFKKYLIPQDLETSEQRGIFDY